ncbi:hypothetical protein [Vibrio renipiscarius]|nr:hypothetical protein [Vibrio renipiscarius]
MIAAVWLIGSILLLMSAVNKGRDDWHSQVIRNQMASLSVESVETSSDKALLDGTLLDDTLEPDSFGPFIDHGSIGLYYSWIAFQSSDEATKRDFAKRSIEQLQLQLHFRPLDSAIMINKANQLWRNGEGFDDVMAEFELAQHLGPYEPLTVKESLTYYLAYWPELSSEKKNVVLSYLLDHEKYKMKLWQYDSILVKPIIGERACAILGFNNITPYYCRG